jgi:hypothetical protein
MEGKSPSALGRQVKGEDLLALLRGATIRGGTIWGEAWSEQHHPNWIVRHIGDVEVVGRWVVDENLDLVCYSFNPKRDRCFQVFDDQGVLLQRDFDPGAPNHSIVTRWGRIESHSDDIAFVANQDLGRAKEKIGDSNASGFSVSSDGHVVTAYHAVDHCSVISAFNAEGSGGVARLLSFDADLDIAVLDLAIRFNHFLKIRVDQPVLGEFVLAAGFPLSRYFDKQLSVFSGVVSASFGFHGDENRLRTSARLHKGSSGGPLLDESANLIGAATSGLDRRAVLRKFGEEPADIFVAAKSYNIASFLEQSGVRFFAGDNNSALSSSDVAEVARKVTFQVRCRND